VLAGVAIHESRFWNLVQAIRTAELELFGIPLHQLGIEFIRRDTFEKEELSFR
jgi:hypothetical protein